MSNRNSTKPGEVLEEVADTPSQEVPQPEDFEQASRTRRLISPVLGLSPDLLSLGKLPGPISIEEARQALEHVSIVVIADDERAISMALSRIVSRTLRGGEREAVILKGDVDESFEKAMDLTDKELPIIICQNGEQAEEAIQEVIDRQLHHGILGFDNSMGAGKQGVELFNEYRDELPASFARIVQTGDGAKLLYDRSTPGALDHVMEKPVSTEAFYSEYAKAFLRRQVPQLSEYESA